jgi:hypothetical protein
VNIHVFDSAQDDLAAGFQFYENQCSGLGEYFLNSLSADIRSLQIYAGIHSRFGDYYRLLAKRFPFAIYYKLISTQDVLIYAVLDTRKNPDWIKDRLSTIQ